MYRNRANSRYYQRHRQDQESNSVQATVMEQFKESWLTAIIGLILFATGMCLFVWNEVGNKMFNNLALLTTSY